jgi:UDP-N-acetyl-D-mannosaminuronate dehydrogenase
MPEYAAERIEAALGSLTDQSVLLLGVAYRGDVREPAFSAARRLQEALIARGASVYVHDPLFNNVELCALGYVPFEAEHAARINAIALQADHQEYQSFDWDRFHCCKLVLDGRGALRREVIESVGMRYLAIGAGQQIIDTSRQILRMGHG